MTPDLTADSIEPPAGREADAWILRRRGPKNPTDPESAYALLREWEPSPTGSGLADVWTVFLTNRECPWRCLMCDLWKNTLDQALAPGAIPRQLKRALRTLGDAPPQPAASLPISERHLKLYNSGSFFDRQAIPSEDHVEIARQASGFHRVIVECHPSLVGDLVLRFRDQLLNESRGSIAPCLELALGLETAHEPSLTRLNKRMTVANFVHASRFLTNHGVAVRVFLLAHPPFMSATEQPVWIRRSIEVAFDAGATVVSLIPTRVGNGALDRLRDAGLFREPPLEALEEAFEYGLSLRRGRVLADLWDLKRFSRCEACFGERRNRLEQMNWTQKARPPAACAAGCGSNA
ncbi:MAG: radical SAM protein [Verrucomicrobia bacterium]|nr:radical SAM protein [Verrucomicrobiota bacterium]MBI3868896.1 radical SAM protein [Verrucomicrobiota bacterium]